MSDLGKPYEYLSAITTGYPYKVSKLENKTASEFKSGVFDNGTSHSNANALTVSGHGGKGLVQFYNNTYLYASELKNMKNVDIAMWATCYSASSANASSFSMAQASVNAGALSSIGFPETVTVSSSKTFTDRLFKKLAEGKNITESATYAKNGLLWLWDNARDYKIFGDGTKNILAFNVRNFEDSLDLNLVSEFYNDLKNGEWSKHLIGDFSYRYYRTINGLLTDIFYDVEYNEIDEITSISRSKNSYNIINVESTKYTGNAMRIPKSSSISNIKKYNAYITIEKTMVPIELLYYDQYLGNGCFTQKVLCTNLNDNSIIDYEKIHSV